MWFLFQAKFFLPVLVAVTAILAYYVLDLFLQFEAVVSDRLPNREVELFCIMVPPAYSGDLEAQMGPLDKLLEHYDTSQRFQDATLAAAETFRTNESSVSVAAPIQCSMQLYKIDVPPTPDDMWTARGVMVKMENFTDILGLTGELLAGGLGVPIQAIKWGPGPFVYGNHTNLGEGFIFDWLTVNWVESLIDLHFETFGYQDKFVILRLLVEAKNAKGDITETEHVIMKAESLDVYERLHPGHI